MLVSGYVPGAAAVRAIAAIAAALRARAAAAGAFFWVLDPVMGDHGNLYVAADVVDEYKRLVPHADMILPNKFEAELLSGIQIVDRDSLAAALQALHDQYGVPHIVITSVDVPVGSPSAEGRLDGRPPLAVAGSSRTAGGRARPFRFAVPSIDCYFSGTGDMFAALAAVRMREQAAADPALGTAASWLSPDTVPAVELPLARAVGHVLGSLHRILEATKAAVGDAPDEGSAQPQQDAEQEARARLLRTKAAEVRVVRNARYLRFPGRVFEPSDL